MAEHDKIKATILLIDDEEMFLFAQYRLLTRFGYEPLQAESGRQALEIFERRGDEIDLVVLDIVMPEMDGEETFKRLKELDPDVRVLLCSGYSKGGAVASMLSQGALDFIQKPFESTDFLSKIKQLLSRH